MFLKLKRTLCIFLSSIIHSKLSWIIVLMVMFVLISTYSYALFTISIEQKNALSVVAGNLFYRAEDITLPYEVTLQPGESKQLPITIESLNSIDSIYQIYSNDLPEGVSVSYISELGSSKAMIGVAGEKKDVTLVLQNNSSSIQVIHIGIQGGLPEREPIIKDGYTLIPLKIYIKNGKAKILIGVARGKKLYDKRESIKKRDLERETYKRR